MSASGDSIQSSAAVAMLELIVFTAGAVGILYTRSCVNSCVGRPFV